MRGEFRLQPLTVFCSLVTAALLLLQEVLACLLGRRYSLNCAAIEPIDTNVIPSDLRNDSRAEKAGLLLGDL